MKCTTVSSGAESTFLARLLNIVLIKCLERVQKRMPIHLNFFD